MGHYGSCDWSLIQQLWALLVVVVVVVGVPCGQWTDDRRVNTLTQRHSLSHSFTSNTLDYTTCLSVGGGRKPDPGRTNSNTGSTRRLLHCKHHAQWWLVYPFPMIRHRLQSPLFINNEYSWWYKLRKFCRETLLELRPLSVWTFDRIGFNLVLI